MPEDLEDHEDMKVNDKNIRNIKFYLRFLRFIQFDYYYYHYYFLRSATNEQDIEAIKEPDEKDCNPGRSLKSSTISPGLMLFKPLSNPINLVNYAVHRAGLKQL